MPLAVVSSGVVRLGGRRLRACRWSRGRRPNGSGTEATDRRAALPQRHPNGVGGRFDSDSATTRLPTLKAMLTPDLLVLRRIAAVSHPPRQPVPDSTARTLLEAGGHRESMATRSRATPHRTSSNVSVFASPTRGRSPRRAGSRARRARPRGARLQPARRRGPLDVRIEPRIGGSGPRAVQTPSALVMGRLFGRARLLV